MAQITINEVSSNYGFNTGTNSYAAVALPITASWGPGYFAEQPGDETALEETSWVRYPATQAGLESFIAAYRGPATNYRLSKDYSYQMALTLLNAGYDVLICRLCPGAKAHGELGDVARYELLATQPADWSSNYSSYFTHTVGGGYSPVEGVEVIDYADVHSGNKPEDWDQKWNTDYFTQDVDPESPTYEEYILNQIQTWTDAKAQAGGIYKKTTDTVAPTFAVDTYYKLIDPATESAITFTAKYPGSFGNNIQVSLTKKAYTIGGVVTPYWNLIVYVIDSLGVKTPVENLVFVMEIAHSTDTLLHWSEVESNFVDLDVDESCTDDMELAVSTVTLAEGSDRAAEVPTDTVESVLDQASKLAEKRFDAEGGVGTMYRAAIEGVLYSSISTASKPADWDTAWGTDYYTLAATGYVLNTIQDWDLAKIQPGRLYRQSTDVTRAYNIRYMEWLYTAAVCGVYDLLDDKLTYNPNRVVSPGWDDQNYAELGAEIPELNQWEISPIHKTLMKCAYYSRCATAYIDIPKSLPRGAVYEEPGESDGYAQMLARYTPDVANVNNLLFSSHSALFAPWGQYAYVGTSKQTVASPSFLALMIQRAQILNQSIQYEWELPTNRKHNLKIGKLDYNVPKKLLDIWQTLEGVGVNIIAQIPDLGMNVWGNSTLYEVPPATYQALANLSTRWLVNAIEDVVYRVGISITFQYNNSEAYSAFYAGVSPILDTMRNVGAIDDYYITMSADINGVDSVNANSVIGKIYITVNGVINDITVDLIALPPSVSLDQFRG